MNYIFSTGNSLGHLSACAFVHFHFSESVTVKINTIGAEKIRATLRRAVAAERAVIMGVNGRSKMRKNRYEELRNILEERRFEIIGELQHKMRDVRTEGAIVSRQGVCDEAEISEADIQDGIEFSLLQMKAEISKKIGKALSRLEEGTYGNCYVCGNEISEQRLRALPFAVCCKVCEEAREVIRQREVHAARRGGVSLFVGMA